MHWASNCPVDLFRVSDPEGPPAFRVDSLSFVCLSSIPWWTGSYSCYLTVATPSGLPLSGIPFSLYSGFGAAGSPIASASTNSEGVLRFGNLPFGQYSVRVDLPPGYTPVTDPIQDVDFGSIQYAGDFYGTLEGEGFSGKPPPLPGRESFQMGMTFDLEVNGATENVTVNGSVTVRRGAPFDAGGGRLAFETEILSGFLSGNHPVLGTIYLRESPTRVSRGRFQQAYSEGFYPCVSFMDIFLEIRWSGQAWIGTDTATHLSNPVVFAYPPIGALYQDSGTDTVLDDGSTPVPPRMSKVQGRCLPAWTIIVPYQLVPPEPSPTPTATNTSIPTPTQTPDYDQWPPPVGDDLIDARDLMIVIKTPRSALRVLFDFARHWRPTH